MSYVDVWKEEISKMSDLNLANIITGDSYGRYKEMLRDEAIARILMRLK